MLKQFTYKKENGDTSLRIVHPLQIVDNDKMLCVDLTEFDEDERQEYDAILDQIHKDTIQAIKDNGMGSAFRTFFLKGMS